MKMVWGDAGTDWEGAWDGCKRTRFFKFFQVWGRLKFCKRGAGADKLSTCAGLYLYLV